MTGIEDWDSDPEFKELRDNFIASFSERRSKLDALLSRIASGIASGTAKDKELDCLIEDARFIAHKLAGAAASYGFPLLTEVSAAYEEWLSEGGADRAAMTRFGSLLVAMLLHAESGRAEPVGFEQDPRFIELLKAVASH